MFLPGEESCEREQFDEELTTKHYLKNAQQAPARPQAASSEPTAPEPCEIPLQLQKPKSDKALTLANFQTTKQRLVDQVAVPQDTNEEAAVAAHFPKMDLAGVAQVIRIHERLALGHFSDNC